MAPKGDASATPGTLSWVFSVVGLSLLGPCLLGRLLASPWEEDLGCLLWLGILPAAGLTLSGAFLGFREAFRNREVRGSCLAAAILNLLVLSVAVLISIPWHALGR